MFDSDNLVKFYRKQIKTSQLELSCYQEQISMLHAELLQSRNEIFAMKIEKQKLEMELKDKDFS